MVLGNQTVGHARGERQRAVPAGSRTKLVLKKLTFFSLAQCRCQKHQTNYRNMYVCCLVK